MFDVETLVGAGNVLLIAAVVFVESGLLIGFFLPGDTLLFAAGLAASQGKFSLGWLLISIVAAAILGDNVGYSIGRRSGKRLFQKEDGVLFRKEHVQRAQDFYDNHGGKTIILARFVPIVRTFAPVVAGIGKMPRKRFMMFNFVGGVLWGTLMPLLGFWLGKRIPHLDQYIEVVFIAIVIGSFAISFGHLWRDKETRKRLVQKFKLIIRNIFLNKKVD